MSIRIDPEAWYRENDLILQLGVGHETQRTEREAGRLKAVERGASFVYKGQSLLDWLNAKGKI